MQVDIELYRRELRLGDERRITLSAVDISPETPERTLVFLHGYGGSARQWRYQLTRFSDRHRVIAPDLRGHGLSDAPTGDYDLETLLADLDQTVQALQVRRPFVVVGHSFGSALAVEYALRHPGRASHLVLIAASGRFPLAWYFRLPLRLPLPLLNVVYPLLRNAIPAPPHVLHPFYYQTLLPWDGWSRLREVRSPTLVIRGDRDRVFDRPLFERVANEIPEADDVNVGASGHMVMLERREAVNRAIERFLGPARRSWRSAGGREAMQRKRPWLAAYDRGVPATISVPPIRLDELLASAARRYPTRPAVEFFAGKMSYRSLDREVNRFAHGLLARGLQRGDRVLLLLPNLPQMVIGFFGTLRAGGVAAFSTPLSEPDELLRQIRDSQARFLLTLPDLTEVATRALNETGLEQAILTRVDEYLPAWQALAFRLRSGRRPPMPARGVVRFGDLLRGQSIERPLSLGEPDELAVLQYTGGTTDQPKGVMLSHRNLVANALQTRHWLPDVREGREVMLAVLPYSHIYGLMTAMIVPVAMAAAMVVLPRFATREVLGAIRRRRPTLFPGVPAMYTAINDFPGVRRYNVGSIRACISGAAPLPIEVQEAFERLTRGRLVEGYGLTEASPVTHANPFGGVRKPGSIGVPFPSTEAKIVDLASGRDLPQGKIGELAVRGPQVMMGYWNDARATREALTRSGWLLTGDLARIDSDGYFQIVARKKEMILAGKYQVYPRDVEEVLYEHPKVREAAVVGVQARRGPARRIQAYVVLRQGESATEDELIGLCRQRLESYAVPWKIEFVSELPKSFVGKVLRRLLIERSEQDLARTESPDTRRKRR